MKNEPRRFRYSAIMSLSFIAIPIMLLVVIGYFATLSHGISDYVVFLALVSLSAIILVMGVSPLMTAHEISESRLSLRQGWYFHIGIPLQYIGKAERIDNRNYGMGLSYTKKLRRLCVLTLDRNLVRIELNNDVIVRMLGFRRIVGEIIVNVNEPDSFVKALNRKKGDSYESLKFRRKSVGLDE